MARPQTNNDAKPARPVYVYKVPESLSEDVQSIGLVQLTSNEEMMAAKRAGSDVMKLAYEQVLQSLVEVNGERVRVADGTVEKAFNAMGPMVRNLVMTAHVKLHSPPEESVADFLQSREVRLA